MNKQELIESLLYAGFRLMAVALLIIGGLGLLFQLADAWYRFDPSYLGAFLLETVFRSGMLILAGVLLYALSLPLARRMARPFRPPES